MGVDQTEAYMEKIASVLEDEMRSPRFKVGDSLGWLVPLLREIERSEAPADLLDSFRVRFSHLISGDSNYFGLYAYMADCSTYAERGRTNGYQEACSMRSVLQIFNDDFMLWEESRRNDLHNAFVEEIEDIDSILRDVSDEAPPIMEADIPTWAPKEGHWWWRSPVQQDMSEEERRTRLEYDFWDGVHD